MQDFQTTSASSDDYMYIYIRETACGPHWTHVWVINLDQFASGVYTYLHAKLHGPTRCVKVFAGLTNRKTYKQTHGNFSHIDEGAIYYKLGVKFLEC